MNLLLHVAAGTYCLPPCKGPVNIIHLVEDILGGNNLAQGGAPQARAAVMKIIGFEKCSDEAVFLLKALLILINISNIICCIFITCLYSSPDKCQEIFIPGESQCRQAGYRLPDDRRIACEIPVNCIAICAIFDID